MVTEMIAVAEVSNLVLVVDRIYDEFIPFMHKL